MRRSLKNYLILTLVVMVLPAQFLWAGSVMPEAEVYPYQDDGNPPITSYFTSSTNVSTLLEHHNESEMLWVLGARYDSYPIVSVLYLPNNVCKIQCLVRVLLASGWIRLVGHLTLVGDVSLKEEQCWFQLVHVSRYG